MATLTQPKHLRKQTQNHSQFSHRITGVYWNLFGQKRTSEWCWPSQTAGMPCFLQKNGVSVNEEVWGVVDSCFRSVRVYARWEQSLLWLVFTGMRVGMCFAKFSSHVSKDMLTCDIGLSNLLKHAAYLVLDQRDLCTNASFKYLAHASWICYLK